MKKLISLIMSLVLVFGASAVTASAATSKKATTLRLELTEGNVKANNKNGTDVKTTDGMKLFSGYSLTTSAKSYAYLSLDDSKTAKMDENSKTEISKSGDKLELMLSSGNIFFDVSKPLEGKESFNIRTSTMTTGIRGTCGVASSYWGSATPQAPPSSIDSILLLSGRVEISIIDPRTGESLPPVALEAGQIAFISGGAGGAGGAAVPPNIQIRDLSEEDLPGFLCVEIAGDPRLQQIVSINTPLSLEYILNNAPGILQQDQQRAEERQQEIDELLAEQEGAETVDPLFKEEATPTNDSGAAGDDSGSVATYFAWNDETYTEWAAFAAAYTPGVDDITVSGIGVADSSFALGGGDSFNVSSGSSFTIDSGVTFDIQNATLNVDGRLVNNGEITNGATGTINNNSLNSFYNIGTLTNDGTISNLTGRFVNSGILNNNTMVAMGNSSVFENSGSVFGTEIEGAVELTDAYKTAYMGSVINSAMAYIIQGMSSPTILLYSNITLSAPLTLSGETEVNFNSFSISNTSSSVLTAVGSNVAFGGTGFIDYLNNTGILYIGGGDMGIGDITVNYLASNSQGATIYVLADASMSNTTSFNNSGDIQALGEMSNSGTFTNTGTISIGGIEGTGDFTNMGTLLNQSTINTEYGVINNTEFGTLNNASGSILMVEFKDGLYDLTLINNTITGGTGTGYGYIVGTSAY